MNLHSFKFSGLANTKVLNVSPVTTGKKESVVLTTRHKKASRASRPGSMLLETGLNKKDTKGLAALDKVMDAGYYRRDLLDLLHGHLRLVRAPPPGLSDLSDRRRPGERILCLWGRLTKR